MGAKWGIYMFPLVGSPPAHAPLSLEVEIDSQQRAVSTRRFAAVGAMQVITSPAQCALPPDDLIRTVCARRCHQRELSWVVWRNGLSSSMWTAKVFDPLTMALGHIQWPQNNMGGLRSGTAVPPTEVFPPFREAGAIKK